MSKSNEGSDIFVANLRRIMDEQGLKQVDIVHGLKVSTATVSQWVNGTIYPRIGMMQRLADFLNVSVSDLTSDQSNPPSDPRIAEVTELLKQVKDEDKALILAMLRRWTEHK